MIEEVKYQNPILIVDNMPNDKQMSIDNDEINDQKISQSEEILLTLIAEIIVEIVLKEDL